MSNWFIKLRNTTQAKIRIFLFHYAGGSASAFHGWEKYFRPDIDVFAVQAPGRDSRFSESPISDMGVMTDCLLNEINHYLDIPCVFVGHSMGGLIAYELARKLESMERGSILHLVLSAVRAPFLPDVRPSIYNLPYEEIIEALKDYSKTSNEVLENPDVMQLFIPMLRADFSVGDTFKFHSHPKLKCRVSLFSGMNDDFVPIVDAKAWHSLVDCPIRYIDFEGGHFFIHDEQDKFVAALREIVIKEFNCSMKLEYIK